jgi:hypothetical protein
MHEKCHHEGTSVTKTAKSNIPSVRVAGITRFEAPSIEQETVCSGSSKDEKRGRTCLKKTSTKSEIADQIGLHLRSVYDDILAQPVPGRFLELLRQLESSSEVRTNKDGM